MYDDLIKELREQSGYLICKSRYVSEKRQELFKKAADTIEELSAKYEKALRDLVKCGSAPRWIPVTERLPEDEKDVLACYGFVHDGVMSERRFIGVLEYFAFDYVPHWQHESSGLSVTHWMPLPEPPKED